MLISGARDTRTPEVQQLIDWAEQQIFSLSERRLSQGFEGLDSVLAEGA